MAPTRYPFKIRRSSLIFVLITLLMIAAVLSWLGYARYQDFTRHQDQLMRQAVQSTAEEINIYVRNLRRTVGLFARYHQPLISELAAKPEDVEAFEQLKAEIAQRFPNYFAVTIANARGEPVLGNYDLLVNEVCQQDLYTFVQGDFHYDVFIHPHPDAYHIDIMTPWPGDKENSIAGAFFISFKPDDITRLLRNGQLPEHHLMLIKNDIQGLIELTADGTRYQLMKNNARYFLTAAQRDRIGFSMPVDGTRWTLVDIPQIDVHHNELVKIITQFSLIFAVFVAVTLVFLHFNRKEENRRYRSEQALREVKRRLESALDFSDVATWEYHVRERTFKWSSAASELFEDQMPANLSDYLQRCYAADRERVNTAFRQCIQNNQPLHLEHRFEKGKREMLVWFELSGNLNHPDGSEEPVVIGLLRDITTRKEAENMRLHQEVRQRTTLIREIHHRIKNNLQGVVGLLRQHTRKGNVSEAVIDHAVSQLYSVSLVYGLQSQSRDQSVSISELVTAVCKSANAMTGTEIHPYVDKLTAGQVIVNEHHAVALALVINELVFNAIKHSANSAQAAVHVELRIRHDKVDLTILNADASLPDEFDFLNNQGLGTGLSLIKSLLPREGAALNIVQVQQGVKASLILSTPIIMKHNEQYRYREHGAG